MALILTFLSGLFFLVGIIVYHFANHKKEIAVASIATAAIVIIGLIVGDLIPELIELNKWWVALFVLLGLIVLMAMDRLIPHHHHDHHENDEEESDHQDHLKHIGIITILALLLHNIIEGMALYSVAVTSLKSGVLMLLGIGLHNLPFGFQIATYNKDKKSIVLIVMLVLSGFFGGLLFSIFGEFNIIFEGIIIAITLGMILHILIFELLKEVLANIKKKETIYGIIIGIILLIMINLI